MPLLKTREKQTNLGTPSKAILPVGSLGVDRTTPMADLECHVDDDGDVQNPTVAYDIVTQLKTIGTSLYKKGDYDNAQKKCLCRFII